ncbi:MAG: diguanylate cyclase domain-containing protein, partial [Acidiferrobacter sp.]
TIHNTALSTLTNQSSLLAVGVDGFLDNYKIAARGLDSYLQADPQVFSNPQRLVILLHNAARIAPHVEGAAIWNAAGMPLASYAPHGPLPNFTMRAFTGSQHKVAVGYRIFAYGHWVLPLRFPITPARGISTYLIFLINANPLLRCCAQTHIPALKTYPHLTSKITRNDGAVLFSHPMPNNPAEVFSHVHDHTDISNALKSETTTGGTTQDSARKRIRAENSRTITRSRKLATIPAVASVSIPTRDLLTQFAHDIAVDALVWVAFVSLILLSYRNFDRFTRESQKSEEYLHALQKAERMYQAVISVDSLLLHKGDEETIFQRVCDTLLATGLFDIIGVAILNKANRLRFRFMAGPGADVISGWQQEAEESESVAWFAENAFEQGTLQVSNDLSSDPRYIDALKTSTRRLRAMQWRSVGAFPIFRDDKPYSVLALMNKDTGFFNRKLQDLGQSLAETISYALEARRLQKQVDAKRVRESYLAYHDALTGLPNRHSILQKIPEAMARARRNDRMFVICMMDLDDFKPINDTYGHAAGDKVLQEVAARLQGSMRETDTVARLGGDEFILLFEAIERWDSLEQILTRVLSDITEAILLPDGSYARLGVSIGVTVYPLDDDEPEILLRHTDIALYEQKFQKHTEKKGWGLYRAGSTEYPRFAGSIANMQAPGTPK